jgi:hypothetical protein
MACQAAGYKRLPCSDSRMLCRSLCRLDSPIAELELASTGNRFSSLMDGGYGASFRCHNLKIVRLNTSLDYVFILLYSLSYSLFAASVSHKLFRYIVGAISVAAMFDVLENLLMFRALSDIDRSVLVRWTPSLPSHAKWVSLSIATVLLAIALLTTGNKTHRMIGFLMLTSGILTIVGLFVIPLLTLSMLFLLVALFVSVLAYSPQLYRPRKSVNSS